MNSTYLSERKIFNHLDRLQRLLKNEQFFPVTIQIDPTNNCTRNCPRCAGNRYGKNDQLSLKFMKDVIDQISPFCKGIIITGGGEPLCNKDTLVAIRYARTKKIEVGLVSNSDLIDYPLAIELVKLCSYIRISYNDDKIWDKIKFLVKAKKNTKSKCTIGIGFLTNKKNSILMKNAVETAKRFKVDYLQFRPFHMDTYDASPKIIKLQKKFENQNFKVISSEYKYIDMKNKIKKTKKYPVCLGDNFRTVIAADGKMYPDCYTRKIKNFCFGDLNKDSFKIIWLSQKRKKVFENKLNFKDCPTMSYHDPLDELLWNVQQQYQNGKHTNFI